MGSKGIGEIGIVGTAAAVANAVFHATGKRVRDLPIRLDRLVGVGRGGDRPRPVEHARRHDAADRPEQVALPRDPGVRTRLKSSVAP